jgi:quercetin dioxygenase-like cupin family protein
MGYRLLRAEDAFWRPSNQMGVLNTDLGKQLEAETLSARLWRLAPGQGSTRHRHRQTAELYVLLEGTGRIRADGELLTLSPMSAVLVDPDTVRQVFNDTDSEQLWLIVGAPPEGANTLEMTAETIAFMYPDGPKALPPELEQTPPAGGVTHRSLA